MRPSLRDLFERALARSRAFDTGHPFDRLAICELTGSLEPSDEARDRGLRLLKENLSPIQRVQYEKHGYFIVVGGQTGSRYRIRSGCQLNVEQLSKNDMPLCVLCFMPKGDLVDGDVMLAQKLALELFEFDALKVARVYPAAFTQLGPAP
jgi:hypothetical protein